MDKGIWVFLSHSNKDYEKVRQVRNILEQQGYRPLMFFLNCLNDDNEIDGLIKREIELKMGSRGGQLYQDKKSTMGENKY